MINIKSRIYSLKFWSFIVALYISTTGANVDSFTSWHVLGDSLVNFISNPFQFIAFVWAVVGIFTDTSSKGFLDGGK